MISGIPSHRGQAHQPSEPWRAPVRGRCPSCTAHKHTHTLAHAETHSSTRVRTHAIRAYRQTRKQVDTQTHIHTSTHARTTHTHTHNHAKMHTLPSPQRQKQAKPQTHMRTHKHTRTTHTQTQRRLMWPTRTHVHPHGASHISTHIAHYTQASRHTGTQVGAHPIPGSGWVEPACS